MLDILLETKTSQAAGELGIEGYGGKERVWVAPLADNRRKWKEQCQPPVKGTHQFSLSELQQQQQSTTRPSGLL